MATASPDAVGRSCPAVATSEFRGRSGYQYAMETLRTVDCRNGCIPEAQRLIRSAPAWSFVWSMAGRPAGDTACIVVCDSPTATEHAQVFAEPRRRQLMAVTAAYLACQVGRETLFLPRSHLHRRADTSDGQAVNGGHAELETRRRPRSTRNRSGATDAEVAFNRHTTGWWVSNPLAEEATRLASMTDEAEGRDAFP